MAAAEVCNARSFIEHEYMLLLSKTFGLSGKSREYSLRYIVGRVFFRNGVLRVRRGFCKTVNEFS